jgi:hypothetical protein
MTNPKPPKRIALGALLLPTSLALAQPVTMPTQVPDVLSFEVSGGVEQHSNIFRTPDGPSDTVLRGLLGVRFEREVSLQRFTAFANVQPVKYLDFSRYDYVGYALGGTWDWEVGRPLFGTFSAGYTRDQSPFDAVGGPINNLRDLLTLRALAGFRMTQNLSAIGAVDYFTLDNSALSLQSANFDRQGLEAGLRYAPETAATFDFVYRRENGDYPNRQVFDANGNVLPAAVDNAYTQDALLMRIGYRPSDLTRLVGTIGYTRRSFENVPQRDFGGITGSLDWERPLSGAFLMRASVFRLIDVTELLNANFVLATGAALRPTWTLTSRTTLDGILAYTTRSYVGDPGFVFTGLPVRKDKLLEFGVRLNYEVARRVFLYADLRRLDRSSNYDGFDFTDNWYGAGVRALF